MTSRWASPALDTLTVQRVSVIPPRPLDQSSQHRRRVGFITMGCKVNAYESALIAQGMQSGNAPIKHRDLVDADEASDLFAPVESTESVESAWQVVPHKQQADAYIINTCTVTAEADRQARQEVRRAVRRNPDALIVVTGCYAQMDPDACAQIPGVDFVVGNARKLDLPALLPKMLEQSLAKITIDDVDEHTSLPQQLLSGLDGRSRAFLQIQQGCDQGCTFCIIHVARGRSRSIDAAKVVRQAERLVMNGYRELVICGVDLGSWGEDLHGPDESSGLSMTSQSHDLASLLTELNAIEGDFRIRLSSLDPAHIDDKLIDAWASLEKICPHLHLSLQSGNTLILKRMKRRYDRALVDERIDRLRAAVPDLTISADVMVGFPTETDEHFSETLAAITQLQIAWPHTFSYSPREGTPAARIPRQTPADVKKSRADQVREAGRGVHRELLKSRVGKCVRVLCEDATGRNADNLGMQRARARDYTTVYFPASGSCKPGDFVAVRVTGVSTGQARGSGDEIALLGELADQA